MNGDTTPLELAERELADLSRTRQFWEDARARRLSALEECNKGLVEVGSKIRRVEENVKNLLKKENRYSFFTHANNFTYRYDRVLKGFVSFWPESLPAERRADRAPDPRCDASRIHELWKLDRAFASWIDPDQRQFLNWIIRVAG